MSDGIDIEPRCEDCEAETERTGGWSKPSGTAGSETSFVQHVERADFLLGHEGYLCTLCWWTRAKAKQAA